MARSNEAFWWSLFSAGGVMAALFVPAFIFVTGFLLPFMGPKDDHLSYERVYSTIAHWPVRVVLLGIIFLTFFHCAHRIRHLVTMFGIRPPAIVLSGVCYGGALAGSIAALVALIRL